MALDEQFNARLIDEEGHYRTHQLPEGSMARLEALQDAVGGPVEAHEIPGGMVVWMDEEARLKGTRRNVAAERIVEALGLELYGGILGTAVFTGTDGHGGTVALTPEQVATLDSHITHA